MNNLNVNITEIVVTLCLFPFLVMAIWGVMYFAFKIYLRLRIRKELGDMPGREEVSKLYEEINEQITNPFHKK